MSDTLIASSSSRDASFESGSNCAKIIFELEDNGDLQRPTIIKTTALAVMPQSPEARPLLRLRPQSVRSRFLHLHAVNQCHRRHCHHCRSFSRLPAPCPSSSWRAVASPADECLLWNEDVFRVSSTIPRTFCPGFCLSSALDCIHGRSSSRPVMTCSAHLQSVLKQSSIER